MGSIQSVCSRRRLASHERMMCRRLKPEAFGGGLLCSGPCSTEN
jgi:hypothetical protein